MKLGADGRVCGGAHCLTEACQLGRGVVANQGGSAKVETRKKKGGGRKEKRKEGEKKRKSRFS